MSAPPHVPLAAHSCPVVLVNFNGAAHTLSCLRALAALRPGPGRVLVVDNGSEPDEIDCLLQGWRLLAAAAGMEEPVVAPPAVPLGAARSVLLPLSVNNGFAAGNNAALRLLLADPECRAVWLLNSDTQPAAEALQALCARLEQSPGAGICGSTLVLPHREFRVQCAAGGTFQPWLAATRHLCEGGDAGRLPATEAVESRLDYVIGASMLIRREVFESIGLLPEEHFLYGEDVDFCLRACAAGFGLAWARDSVVRHHEGGSSGARGGEERGAPRRSRTVDYLSVRNRFRLVRKHRPWALATALLAVPFVLLANRLRRGQADRCGLVLRAVRDGVLGRMGKPEDVLWARD